MDSRTQYNLLNLAFSIIIRITEGDFIEAIPLLDEEDFKIISQDPKAMHLLEETDKTFRERYKTFIKLKKKSSKV